MLLARQSQRRDVRRRKGKKQGRKEKEIEASTYQQRAHCSCSRRRWTQGPRRCHPRSVSARPVREHGRCTPDCRIDIETDFHYHIRPSRRHSLADRQPLEPAECTGDRFCIEIHWHHSRQLFIEDGEKHRGKKNNNDISE